MRLVRSLILIAAGVTLSACATVETASRNASLKATSIDATVSTPMMSPSFDVQAVNVIVPETLSVSEANRYYPVADIVWREDSGSDRHAQVKAIVQTAADRGTEGMNGETPVIVEIQVDRFHSLTEKARYSVGGVHNVVLQMGVRDAATNEFIVTPYRVEMDLPALGGDKAIVAERQGITQKVNIIDNLSKIITAELSKPIPYSEGEALSQLDVETEQDAAVR